MEPHPILQSLLATTTTVASSIDTKTTSTTNFNVVGGLTSLPAKAGCPNIISNFLGILFRVILISFIMIISLWANHEASKGFSVNIVSDAGKFSLSGKRFTLFYESNDKVTRIVLNTSLFVENILYPNENFKHMKKQVDSVTIRLAPTNFPNIISVDSPKPHEYLISLSPSLMESSSNNAEVVSAVLQGMARVWLWDGKRETPPVLMDGIVEYIRNLAGFTPIELLKSGSDADATMLEAKSEVCWKDKDSRKVAGFLRYRDQSKQAEAVASAGVGGEVIRRLNENMRNEWHDWMMDDALGMPGQKACASYNMKMSRHHYPYSM